MSKQGEIGDQLVKWKQIQTSIDACTDTMKKNELKYAEYACKRRLSTMVRCWSGNLNDAVKAQP